VVALQDGGERLDIRRGRGPTGISISRIQWDQVDMGLHPHQAGSQCLCLDGGIIYPRNQGPLETHPSPCPLDVVMASLEQCIQVVAPVDGH